MSKTYDKIKVTKLPQREIEIEGEISKEHMAEMHKKALAKLKETVEMDGFRKGNVPDNLIVQKVGAMKILEDAAEMALNKAYPEILEEKKIDAVGRPEITITKIAPDNELIFKIKTALAPEIKLGDYKKIAQELNAESLPRQSASSPRESARFVIEVTDKEIEDVIKDVRRNVAHNRMHEEKGLEGNDHSHEEIKDEDLPEIDEQFLKEIGGFPSLEDLKSRIKENIIKEKESKAKDKKRTEILEKIITDSKIDLPKLIIDSELQKMLAQFKDDVARSNINYDEYLTHIKKSEDDLKNEWRPLAEKRAKSQIALNTIAREENITPKEEEIKKEMEVILAHDKNLDRFRVRMFVEGFLTNELVFQFLENI